MKNHPASIIILDMGSQTATLIARRIRELKVYCELVPPTISPQDIHHLNPQGIIVSGGPASVHDKRAPHIPNWILKSDLPVLGICYGMQDMAHCLGGRVSRSSQREFGPARIKHAKNALFTGLPNPADVWMSHGDYVEKLPSGFASIASTNSIQNAAITDNRKLFGIQFHPEVTHTPQGDNLLANFVFKICKCTAQWNSKSIINSAVNDIRSQVADARVVCALSGGVDSAVVATLAHRAVGDQLTCVFVDNGLMRLGEKQQIQSTFQNMNINFRAVNARNEFLKNLSGVTNPEQKRKCVGKTFIKVFEKVAQKIGQVDFLVQGTTYPDVIESAGIGNTSQTIKSHHNVGGLPKRMKFKLIEPLKYLFKDEVRAVGRELGLPDHIINRQPYPGPGLAIRIIGKVTPQRVKILQRADAIVLEEIKSAGLYTNLWQSFAVLTNTQTVGVQGDARTYGYVACIRAVTATDAMTADWARLPDAVLSAISTRIINEIPNINRVVYDITPKPPGTIEWE